MRRRRFIEVTGAAGAWVAAGGLSGLLASCGERSVARRGAARRVVVLGVGGMDAGVVERMMAEGKLPNLAALARAGTFATLRTTTPAEAPVAWAAFATGAGPGRNGIFGHFGRNADTYRTTVADIYCEPGRYLGDWPIGGPRYRSNLNGEPFWRYAAREGIATAALWAPADFPPQEVEGSSFLAGGDVPDASLGANNYHFFATDKHFGERDTAAGGIWRKIDRRGGAGRVALEPPACLAGRKLEITFEPETELYLNISVAGRKQRVRNRSYSHYFSFPFGRGVLGPGRVMGRFFVASSAPEIRVWLSPLEVDPRKPLFDVAAPARFGEELAADGPFSTRGRPLDLGALYDGVIGRGPFVGQYCTQVEEKRRLGLLTWQRHQPDLFLLFDYGLDEIAQVFWRHYDPAHPTYDDELFFSYGEAFELAYRYVDETLGKFLRAAGSDDVAFFVVSAHGNRPFRRSFCPGRWLLENGYLELAPGAKPWGVDAPTPEAALRRGRYRPAVAWERTRAYAQGYGQIYINVKGREKRGTVAHGEVKRLKAELRGRLLDARDGGRKAVVEVGDGDELFAGPRRFCAPDLVVSLADGYRVSWESVLGGFACAVFADNRGVVSGHHASVAPDAVRGLIFSNLTLDAADAAVEDAGPTILRTLGLEPPGGVDGVPMEAGPR
jgi:predicted AlkP superfamily phosphohydrolase/phosphomutase